MNSQIVRLGNEPILGDPYMEFLRQEGVPVYEDFGVDLFEVEPKPWDRFGANGAVVHLKGRGDFISMFLFELPPGKSGSPQCHMYEEVVYVLSGAGSTTIESAEGRKHSFEWSTGSLFAIPLNAKYRHFNGSGIESAKLICTTNVPAVMNMFHNTGFVFNSTLDFSKRMGQDKHFGGGGDFIPIGPGKLMWETNFVPDLVTTELKHWPERGAGGKNVSFMLADGTMHAHISEMPVGTYKKAHAHPADFHVMCVVGEGYSLLWYPEDKDFTRVDWKYGTVFAPPDNMFHQHFNTSNVPARYLATAFGNKRYPFTEAKRKALYGGLSTGTKNGGSQIEYEDQSPLIARLYKEATQKNGVEVRMSEFNIPEN
jgi:mannose-6-phosphate isomerase-like protein (cupin superfamily)